jgi:membrane protease YdiL (CAAX protease family)
VNSADEEFQRALPEAPRSEVALKTSPAIQPVATDPQPWETRVLLSMLLGPQGLRAGWSVLLFILLYGLFSDIGGFIFFQLNLIDQRARFTASASLISELVSFIGVVGAAAIVAFIERRPESILAFNLGGPRRLLLFIQGLAAGFIALSVLISALAWGGWLHFGPIALSGPQIFKYAVLWGIAFLLVGCVEEGMFRCYLLFTLTRGINFWWALGIVGAICLELVLTAKGNGVWGIYILALLGLVPCLLLHLNKTEGSNFWQAAWVTSVLFGSIHTSNSGENWIGIFAAAAIGFVFAVSVRVTGSAWWAIGCHAAWDWAETYFYGAADSGNVATTGHYLTTSAAGSTLWSGGTDGPEGSVLVIGAILLLLVVLVVQYGRRKPATVLPAEQLERAAS